MRISDRNWILPGACMEYTHMQRDGELCDAVIIEFPQCATHETLAIDITLFNDKNEVIDCFQFCHSDIHLYRSMQSGNKYNFIFKKPEVLRGMKYNFNAMQPQIKKDQFFKVSVTTIQN